MRSILEGHRSYKYHGFQVKSTLFSFFKVNLLQCLFPTALSGLQCFLWFLRSLSHQYSEKNTVHDCESTNLYLDLFTDFYPLINSFLFFFNTGLAEWHFCWDKRYGKSDIRIVWAFLSVELDFHFFAGKLAANGSDWQRLSLMHIHMLHFLEFHIFVLKSLTHFLIKKYKNIHYFRNLEKI